jgi:RNA 2',3'-cyclic 3'-phosphodiesterase
MRIFIGIDLAPDVRSRIERFIEGVQAFAPEARWMRPESLHITLKFIGEQQPQQIAAITDRLRRIEGRAMQIHVHGYGFFPNAKSARVFWIGIHADPELTQLAKRIDEAAAELGVTPEERPYSPHLTLARAGGRSGSPKWRKSDSPNSVFAALEKRLAAMKEIDFGTMKAHEFILYQSQLSRGGSKYTQLQHFPLPGDSMSINR